MFFLFFFNDTATTEIYTLSLHDALPICSGQRLRSSRPSTRRGRRGTARSPPASWPSPGRWRSEEHMSELQSRSDLVCRLLLEKKKKQQYALEDYPYEHSRTTRQALVYRS